MNNIEINLQSRINELVHEKTQLEADALDMRSRLQELETLNTEIKRSNSLLMKSIGELNTTIENDNLFIKQTLSYLNNKLV